MFCSACGKENQDGLRYCSRCGRRVPDDQISAGGRPPLTVAGNTAGVGFVGFIFVLLILSKTGAAPNIFVPLSLVYFAALFGICWMIIRSGSSHAAYGRSPADHDQPGRGYVRPATTAQLLDNPADIGSVTDATTRTLEEVPVRKF